MAQQKDHAPQPPRRRKRGFEAAASLLSARVQHVAEGRGFAVARLLTHWSDIVGATLAAQTRPVKVSHSRGGFGATLTLLTTGPAAPMVEMQLPQLRERVNACYGYNAIQRIRLTQTAPSGFAEGQARFTPAPHSAPHPDPAVLTQARDVGARFDDPDLSAAIAQLTLNHAQRRSRMTRKDQSA